MSSRNTFHIRKYSLTRSWFLIKGNHFFYYEDVFHRISSINSLGKKKYESLVDWVSKEPNKNAVILLDNVNACLHPDWQYNIVKDLENSGVSQFIMATHSYDLCEALTPSQVLTLGNWK
jgi:predicted ATP-binding protein involved in virulence